MLAPPAISSTAISLISEAEAQFLTRLVEQRYSSEGVIVDGGAFVGASTRALAMGLGGSKFASNGNVKPIIAIDHFQVLDTYIHENLLLAGHDVRFGESFIDIFLDNVRDYLVHIEVRAGDLLRVGRIERPIEIAFIDIAKTRALNAFALSRWFRRLIPGKSHVVQQDFHSPAYPWLAVSMSVLLPYFDVVAAKIGESAVFRLRAPIPAAALRTAIATDPLSADGLSLLDRLIQAMPQDARYMLQLMKCLILHGGGRKEEALALLSNHREAHRHIAEAKWVKWVRMTEQSLAGASV